MASIDLVRRESSHMNSITLKRPLGQFYFLNHVLTYLKARSSHRKLLKASRKLLKAQEDFKRLKGLHALNHARLADSLNRLKAGGV